MGLLSIGKMLTAIVIFIMISGILANYTYEWGTPAGYQALSSYTNTTNPNSLYNQNNNSLYNPFVTYTKNAINQTPSAGQSSALGFSYAFIIGNYGNIFGSLLNSPAILGTMFTQMIGGLQIVGGTQGISQTALIINGLLEIMNVFLLLLAISGWQKYPLF